MKRLIVAAALLIGVVVACTVTCTHLTRSADLLIDRLDEMETTYLTGDTEACRAQAERFIEEFHQATRWFPFYMRHADITKIEETVVTLPVILEQSGSEHFATELARCRNQLENLAKLERPSWENVF